MKKLVQKGNPAKQGLKLNFLYKYIFLYFCVQKGNPAKQGLKLPKCLRDGFEDALGPKRKSSKTRIETIVFSVRI